MTTVVLNIKSVATKYSKSSPVVNSASSEDVLTVIHSAEQDRQEYEAVSLYLITSELANLQQNGVQIDAFVSLRHVDRERFSK